MFDPYHKWLGIPTKDQPPNHYRLLHLDLYESDLDVIEGAADRAMGFIRQYQSGEHAALAAKLLNEIATARICLLKPVMKAEYDAKLRKELAVAEKAKATDDDKPYAFDAKSTDLESPPKIMSPVRQKKSRSKRKKSQSSSQLLIGGGVGAVAVVALLVLSNRGAKLDQKPAPSDVKVTDVKATASPEIAAQPTKNSVPVTLEQKSERKTDRTVEQQPTGVEVEQVGPEVDLIPLVDIARDQAVGDCKKEGNTLFCGPKGQIYLPTKLPADYQLRFTIKRLSGNDGFGLGFMMDGRQGLASFDAYNSTVSGLYLDGRSCNANCSTRSGTLFREGVSCTVVLTIHPGHVIAQADGRNVIDWYGHSDRFFVPPDTAVVNRESARFGTDQSPHQIEAAVMIPIKPEPSVERLARLDRDIDLLPLIVLDRDKGRGTWELSKGGLSGKGDGAIYLPTEVPDEYTLSATVELPLQAVPESEIAFGLINGKSNFQITSRSNMAGVDMIDGKRFADNETRVDRPILNAGTAARFECTVTKTGIRAEVDGKTLIDWRGDLRRLSIPGDRALADSRRMFLGTIHPCKFAEIKIGPPRPAPSLPPRPPFEVGTPVDLLALVDPARDALRGTWLKEGKALRFMGDADAAKLLIPCEPPAEYKLTIRVTRDNGGKGVLVLKLPIETHTAEVGIDGSVSTVSGIEVDGFTSEDPKNAWSRRIHSLPQDLPQELVAYVRQQGVKVVRGKDVLVDWQGNPDRLWQMNLWGAPSGRLVLGSWNQRFRFDKIELEPLPPSPFRDPLELASDGNLLSMIDPLRDSRIGEWKLDEKGLVSPRLPSARIRLPAPLPQRYLLTAEVERRVGFNEFCVGLNVNGQACAVAIDGAQCSLAGLMSLDSLTAFDVANPTRRAYATPILPIGRKVKIQCYVMPDTLIVNCGDRTVIRWHGDARRLSLGNENLPANYSANDREHLWLGGRESEFMIHKLNLRSLDDDEAGKIVDGFTGVYPIAVMSNVEAEVGVPFEQATSDPLVKGDTYLILSGANGRCLSVKNTNVVSGPFAVAAGPAERWRLLQSAKDFKLINEKSGKVLDVPGSSKAGNTQLVEYQDSNTDNERWEFVPAGNHYHICSRSSGLVVAVAGGLKEEGSRVIQWPLLNSPDQTWRMVKVSRQAKK